MIGSDRQLLVAIRLLTVCLILGVAGLGVFYFSQRYLHPSVSVAERDARVIESEVRQRVNDPELRVALANAYLAGGRYDDAINQSEQVLAIAPNHVGAAFVAAQAYVARGQSDTAIDRLAHALETSADDPMAQASLQRGLAYRLLGQLELEHGEATLAVTELQLALQVDRTNADTLHLLGQALAAEGDLEQAVATYQSALRFVPDFAEVYQDLAMLYDRTGQPRRARFARAMLTYTRGDFARAAQDLEQSVLELPDVAEVHLGLGMAEEHLGHREAALSEYRLTASLDSTSFAAKQGIGRVGGEL